MKKGPMDCTDSEYLCEMWKKANYLQGTNLNPRVALYRADFRMFERSESPRPSQIKEEQEEVTIKHEEEQFMLTRPCVKDEDEDKPLLLLYDAPESHGYIRALIVQRVDRDGLLDFIKKRDTSVACSASTSLENSTGQSGHLNTDEGQTSSFDHSENSKQIHKSKSGRRQSSVGSNKSVRDEAKEGLASPQRSKKAQSKSSSNDPKESHAKKKPLICSDCGASFTFLQNLHRHKKLHTGEKPFSCSVCERNFASSYYLKLHMSACHPDLLPHSCTVCKKGYSSTKALDMHMLSHTKNTICSECGKTFAGVKNLKEHMRIHTGDFPLSCSVCSKGFLGNAALQIHMRSHTGERPFSCSECGTAFRQVKHYRNHMKIHTGERPFSCPVCKRGFSRPNHVTSHMKVHRTKKAFNCEVCHKGFMRKERYGEHMKVHYIQEKYGVTSYGCFK